MRPLRLGLKGFTAFRDPQDVDFSDLDLFALWGPTGSGKSSLLDAMTYALYGKVERVGSEASQLVSQGQPRMAVTLDFSVGDDVYRITRSTPRTGGSTVRLEVKDGDGWVSYGPGGDAVRQVNKIVPQLVGLDYDAFNRSVVLPQGKFAAFLVGDAAKRREILTELLGLELFKRMAHRANERARDAKMQAETKVSMVAREYAGVDDAAVEAAAEETERLEGVAAAAEAYQLSLKGWHADWLGHDRGVADLRECSRDVERLGKKLVADAEALDRHAKKMRTSKGEIEKARTYLGAAEAAATAATEARRELEARHGTLTDLSQRLGVVRRVDDARAELASTQSRIDTAAVAAQTALAALAETKIARQEADDRASENEVVLETARANHEAARRSDLVGALVSGMGAGDPCPVCEKPLERMPSIDSGHLAAAEAHERECEKRARSARLAAQAASTAAAVAQKEAEAAQKALETARADASEREKRVAELEASLKQVFAEGVPVDAASQLEAAATEVADLMEREKAAADERDQAASRLDVLERSLERMMAEVASVRATIEHAGIEVCLERVRAAAPALELPDVWPERLPDEVTELAAVAGRLAKEMTVLGGELQSQVQDRLDAQKALLEQARASAPPGMAGAGEHFATMLERAAASVRKLAEEKVLAAKDRDELTRRLGARKKLEDEVADHQEEHRLYAALHRELKSDNIVEYLQAEALTSLAAAATVHLYGLSGQRYRLTYEGDKFLVVDGWNGDERRDVRTLSGGETFLASLALALALSDQVQLLAVTEKNRLESLFLDEGFGTLDAETLQVVVGAIEQLGVEDRLVGVITHVAELADRLPVRLEVVKSPRGSSIRRADLELGPIGV